MSHFPRVLDLDQLERLVDAYAKKYQHAQPFSHIVIDDFLPPEILEQVLREFPNVNDSQWIEFKAETENAKLASNAYELIPSTIRYVLDSLNTSPFLQFLEKLTGIESLIPDPYYLGGGMHQTKRGGWLDVHVDFNFYEKLKLYRRINVILYLNKDWKEEYGGALELWDEHMKHMHEKVLPVFNRCIIFTTSENSHHGHPDPMTCPEDMTRKSLAWYYYTVDHAANIDDEFHTTVFKDRPHDKKLTVSNLKKLVKYLLPPIIVDLSRKIRRLP